MFHSSTFHTYQVLYAAKDALVAVDMMVELLRGKFGWRPHQMAAPDWGRVSAVCQGLIDAPYRQQPPPPGVGDRKQKQVGRVFQNI